MYTSKVTWDQRKCWKTFTKWSGTYTKKEYTFLNENNHHFNFMLMKRTTDGNDNGFLTV